MKSKAGRILLTGTLGILVLAMALSVAFVGSNGTSVKAEEVSAAQAQAAVAERQLLGLHVFPGFTTKIAADQQSWIKNQKVEVTWSSIETSPGTYDFTTMDAFINQILASGSESLFLLLGGPGRPKGPPLFLFRLSPARGLAERGRFAMMDRTCA